MIKVNVKNGNIEDALKVLKNKVRNTKQVIELRENEEYIKPSVTNREKKRKAVYLNEKKRGEDND